MTTLRPEGRGFRPSRAGVPVSQPIAPGRTWVSDISSAGMAGSVPGYGTTCRQDVLCGVDRGGVDVRPRPGERQRRVHFREVQAAVAPPEPGPGVLRGLPPLPGLEPRMPCALGEERGIGGLLVADRLLQRDGRHLVQPGEFAERAVQHAGLRLVEVCPTFVRRPHDKKSYSIKSGYVNLTRREGERRFYPGLSTGVSTLQKK